MLGHTVQLTSSDSAVMPPVYMTAGSPRSEFKAVYVRRGKRIEVQEGPGDG